MGAIVGRDDELAIIEGFLDQAGSRTLLLTGEAGIGKTTLWTAGVEGAARRAYRTLVCRPTAAEARLGYSALTDLLREVDDPLLGCLPVVQRLALEAVLLRGHPGPAPDPRTVAVGFLSVLEELSGRGPVLVAVDDLQWLDESSANVIGYAARRLSGPIAVLVSMRDSDGFSMPDLRPRDPGRLRRLQVGPLRLAAVHRLLRDNTARSFPHPVLLRINAAATGNPFYALEIARAVADGAMSGGVFPRSLTELLDARITQLGPDVRKTLLAVSAMADPQVEVVRRALTGMDGGELLGLAESHGVVEIDGGRVRFTHPLWANGVYSAASRAQRRAIHRRLSAVVDTTEERARHLALATLGPEPEVVAALDDAALEAINRGAPAAAAELFELAIGLGAADWDRRIKSADCHCQAGDPDRARRLVEEAVPHLPPGPLRAAALGLLGMIHYAAYRLSEAAEVLAQAMLEASDDLGLRVGLGLDMSFVLINLGRIGDALPYALSAVADAEQLGDRGTLAQALAAKVMARFVSGRGFDETTLACALALEDRTRRARVHTQPTTIAGLCYLFVGRFDEARARFALVRNDCLERGQEGDVPLLLFWMVLLECWCGDPVAAQAVASDMAERSMMLGTPVHHAMALAAQAAVGALAGRTEAVRQCASESLALFETAGLRSWAMWPRASLCQLNVSREDYQAAVSTAGPAAVAFLSSMGLGEPSIVPVIPDVAEALIALGRLDDAETLVDQLEKSGRVLDRAWARAVGGRNRALLLAAQGDTGGAAEAIDRALAQHDRLSAPLDRGRALLVKGQLHRRPRRNGWPAPPSPKASPSSRPSGRRSGPNGPPANCRGSVCAPWPLSI